MAISKNPTPPRREDRPKSRGISTKALTYCGVLCRVASDGTVHPDDLKLVHAAVLAGRFPSAAEVSAFSAWTRGTIPNPRWDADTLIAAA